MSIRESAGELLERAADAGMEQPWRLLDCTAREIELQFRALHARRQQRAEEIDLAAWLIGRYAAQGFHGPKRYPRRPEAIFRRPRRMTDAQMKRAFAALAAERSDLDGSDRDP